MNPRWFLRMSQWARNPPSEKRVILFFGILAACLILFGIERFIGWPEWLQMEGTPRGRIAR